jgi:magnesium-transporting ATPase (P-type)
VIRTFDFVSALRRMSVVVKRLKSTSMEVYAKGAPEVMADICERDSCVFLNSFGDDISFTDEVTSSTRLRGHALVLYEAWVPSNRYRGQEHRRTDVAKSSAAQKARLP